MIYITGDTHGPTRLGLRSVDGYVSRFNMSNFLETISIWKRKELKKA